MRREWSQERLAEECQRKKWDIDRHTIKRIEAQTRWVGDFELEELASILNVSIVELLT